MIGLESLHQIQTDLPCLHPGYSIGVHYFVQANCSVCALSCNLALAHVQVLRYHQHYLQEDMACV